MRARLRRREVAVLLGGAALVLPRLAAAQQVRPGKWRVGILAQKEREDVLRQGLRELGYVEGANLVVDVRSNERIDRLAALAAELAALKPDAIFAAGTQAVQAAQRATRTIPIVMLASDPVGDHLVTSLAHPGGNTTGVSLLSPELSGKRIEVLRNAIGDFSSLAVLWQPDDPPAATALKQTEEAARAMHIDLVVAAARSEQDFASAFETVAKAKPRGLVIINAPLMSIHVDELAKLALALKLPSIYTNRPFPVAGGLVSYGPDFGAITKRAATYLDRIFRGANPADLPVEQPTQFQLVINLKTARALGVTIPEAMLTSADEVIE